MQDGFYTLNSGIGHARDYGAPPADERRRTGPRVERSDIPMWQQNKALGSMVRRWTVRGLRSVAVVATAMLLLTGCAALSPGLSKDASPEEKQKAVAARAEARWQALIKGDLETAYTYLSPGSKAATSFTTYKGKVRPGMWRQAKAYKVDCEGEVCRVTMLITYDTKRMKGIETPLTESWIIEEGTPWYVYR